MSEKPKPSDPVQTQPAELLSLLFSDIYDAIQHETMEIAFPELQLFCADSESGHDTVTGPALIRMGTDGFLLTMFLTAAPIKQIMSDDTFQYGRRARHYGIKGQDYGRRLAEADRVFAKGLINSSDALGLFNGLLHEIHLCLPISSKRPCAQIYYFPAFDFELTGDSAATSSVSSKYSLSVSRIPGGTLVEVDVATQMLPENLEWRVIEMLRLLLPGSPWPTAALLIHDSSAEVVLWRVPRRSSTDFPPPFKGRTQLPEIYLPMATRYLDKGEDPDRPQFTDLGALLEFIRNGHRDSSIRQQLLTLSVGVEGVLQIVAKHFDSDLTARFPQPSPKAVEAVAEHMDSWTGSGSDADKLLKTRITNWMRSSLRHPARAKDVLTYLKEQGLVEEKHLNGWDAVRNTVTHAGEVDIKKYTDTHSVLVSLLYRLVFCLIEYKGPTDYATLGCLESKLSVPTPDNAPPQTLEPKGVR